MFRHWTTVKPKLSKRERDEVEAFRQPAPKPVIISILAKLAVHKRMENDQARQVMLFKDYADLLHGEPEYALIQAILHLIEYDTDPYFPPLAVIRKVIDGFKIPEELPDLPENVIEQEQPNQQLTYEEENYD